MEIFSAAKPVKGQGQWRVTDMGIIARQEEIHEIYGKTLIMEDIEQKVKNYCDDIADTLVEPWRSIIIQNTGSCARYSSGIPRLAFITSISITDLSMGK